MDYLSSFHVNGLWEDEICLVDGISHKFMGLSTVYALTRGAFEVYWGTSFRASGEFLYIFTHFSKVVQCIFHEIF